MTSRRGFLGSLLAAVAAPMVLDPEMALWIPGQKLISIPVPAFRAWDLCWTDDKTMSLQISVLVGYSEFAAKRVVRDRSIANPHLRFKHMREILEAA